MKGVSKRPTGCAARLLLMTLTFAAPAMAYIGLVPPMTALMRHPGIQLKSDAPALGRVSSKRAQTLRMSGEVGTARSLMGKGISALEQRLADLGLVNDLVPSVLMVEPIFVAVAIQMQLQHLLPADEPLSSVAMQVRANIAGHLAEKHGEMMLAPENEAILEAVAESFAVGVLHLTPSLGIVEEQAFTPSNGDEPIGAITICSVGPLVWSTRAAPDDAMDMLSASAQGEGLLSEEISERFARARSVSSAVKWMSAASLQASLQPVRSSPSLSEGLEGDSSVRWGSGGQLAEEMKEGSQVAGGGGGGGGGKLGEEMEREREGGGSEVKGGLLGGRLVLIDATTFFVKSYNANARMPRLDGTPTGAVYGFCKLLQELMAEDSGCRVVACFSSGDIGRRRLHSEYKSSQTSIPPPLEQQYGILIEALEAHGVYIAEADSYEAEDLIATYCSQAESRGDAVTVVPGGTLLYQVVSESAELYDPVKCTRTGVGEVEKKFGVPPSMCNDVIALMGDAADGIPGAVGIGVKTAAKMVQQFGGLESMLERVGEVRGKKTQQLVLDSGRDIEVSWQLLRLRLDAPVPELGEITFRARDPALIRSFYSKQGFPAELGGR